MDMLSLPLTGMPALVLNHGAIAPSTFPARGDYLNRNSFWVLNLMHGPGVLELAGRRLAFATGCAVLTPPEAQHSYRVAGMVPFVHAHFRASGGAVPVQPVLALGAAAAALDATLRDAGRRLAAEPERARVALWHVLWQLARGPARAEDPVHHPVVRRLLDHLAERLHEPVRPGQLARRLGVTQRHLNRLCREAFACPLAAYVRQQRLERARQLLQDSDRPVAEIAASVGYPDLQHFNKLVRARWGASPRRVRRPG